VVGWVGWCVVVYVVIEIVFVGENFCVVRGMVDWFGYEVECCVGGWYCRGCVVCGFGVCCV